MTIHLTDTAVTALLTPLETVGTPPPVITSVGIDSRTIQPGALFVAVRGLHTDGHNFVAAAAARGAVAAVVERRIENNTATIPHYVVADAQYALWQLAAYWRAQSRAVVIAVTGSNGKTTVKNMLARICTRAGSTIATEKNNNNEFGVPLTLLRLRSHDAYAIVEIGAAKRGDIMQLARYVQPDIGCITNIAEAHLAGLGNIDGVAEEKSALLTHIRENGTAIINADDRFASQLRNSAGNKYIRTFGIDNADATLIAQNITIDSSGTSRFVLKTGDTTQPVTLRLLGKQNVLSATAAAACADAAGISLSVIAEGLASARAAPGRLCIRVDTPHLCMIDDSYNANPASMRAACDALCLFSGTRIAILGAMAALGDATTACHAELSAYISRCNFDAVLCFGEPMCILYRALSGTHIDCIYADTVDTLIDCAHTRIHTARARGERAVVLIKGSRVMRMERVVDALADTYAAQTQGSRLQ